MKLNEYLERYGIPMSHIQRQTGISVNSIRHAREGHDLLMSNAKKISDATEGCVTLYDLLPEQNEVKEGEHAKSTKQTKKKS